ncbi:urease accessory protein UreD [Egibacter rhizosphaerae]|uniref:Urease accessory protein UreD n=1 Tax=Egibacter rhizosphaerae TaxID=1670831 RepID=A0A411YEP9_9ACTN|nr:urease accessory protein UreD [Egibacter rhizosphaerae]QBI19733.1 urease accessory protein UreD [Egibacter rhizosphaerae]
MTARGRTRIVERRSDPPLVLRPTPEAVHLVGGTAGPLGGDDLALDVEVGPGARLTVRTVAASLVYPGTGPSRLAVTARVDRGGHLDWAPEPTVAIAGCDHEASASIDLAEDATLRWSEQLVLGRSGEAGGRVRSTLWADLAGSPLLRHALDVGGDAPDGPAITAGARAIGNLLVVGPEAAPLDREAQSPERAVLDLAGGGALVTVVGGSACASTS